MYKLALFVQPDKLDNIYFTNNPYILIYYVAIV